MKGGDAMGWTHSEIAVADELARHFSRPDRPALYARIAAVAFMLSGEHPPWKWFPLPSEQIATEFGVHRQTVETMIRSLEEVSVIDCKKRLRRSELELRERGRETGEVPRSQPDWGEFMTGPNRLGRNHPLGELCFTIRRASGPREVPGWVASGAWSPRLPLPLARG
jgi:hypothetical protein